LPIIKFPSLRTGTLFRSAGITFGSKLLVALVNFAVIILLSQQLGDAGKGRCSLYLLIFSIALAISECISGSTITYLVGRFSHRQLLLLFYTWSGAAAVGVGLIFALTGKLPGTEVGWIILLNWLNAVLTIHQQLALGKQKLGLFNALNVGQALLTIATIWLLFGSYQPAPLLYLQALSIAWLLVAITGFLLIYPLPDKIPFAGWQGVAKAGLALGTANQSGILMQLVNSRIAYLLLPVATTGVYSNAVSLCEACLLINSSIGTVQYSRIASLAAGTHSVEAARRQQVLLTQQCFWVNAILMLAALVVLACLPGVFYGWLFGPAFTQVVRPLRLLLPGIYFYSCFIIFTYFFSGTGRFIVNNIPVLAALPVTLLGYGWVRWMNMPLSMGLAAFITGISYFVEFAVALLLFLQREKLTLKQGLQPPDWRSILALLKKQVGWFRKD
jgi:O-antigen/teichoic acid export membrane protein